MFEKNNIDGYLVLGVENKRYCSGFSGTTCEVLLFPNKKYFITDGRYEIRSKEEVKEDFEIIVLKNEAGYKGMVEEVIKRENTKRLGVDGRHASYSQFEELRSSLAGIEVVNVENCIEESRLCKTEEEIDKVKKAVEITDKTFSDLLEFLEEGLTEIDVKNFIDYRHQINGGDKPSFESIVAFGDNTALPHAKPGNRKLKRGDLITIDFGCFYDGYCSDMTRTFFFGEPQNEELIKIHNIVREVHEMQLKMVASGVSTHEIDKVGRDYIKEQGYDGKFCHGTGHGIGLEIHEAPRLNATSDIILRPGMIITIEPGIYVEGLGGVRIENDVVVREGGYESLNKSVKDYDICNN